MQWFTNLAPETSQPGSTLLQNFIKIFLFPSCFSFFDRQKKTCTTFFQELQSNFRLISNFLSCLFFSLFPPSSFIRTRKIILEYIQKSNLRGKGDYIQSLVSTAAPAHMANVLGRHRPKSLHIYSRASTQIRLQYVLQIVETQDIIMTTMSI